MLNCIAPIPVCQSSLRNLPFSCYPSLRNDSKLHLNPLIVSLTLGNAKEIRTACLTEVQDYCICTVTFINKIYNLLKGLNGIRYI